MARHFKEGTVDSTAEMGPVRQGQQTSRRRSRAGEQTASMPYGEGASYHYSYPGAVRGDGYGFGDEPVRGGIARPIRALLLMLAWILRLAAIALAALVLINVIPLPVGQRAVTELTDKVCSYIPWSGIGMLVIDTPFSGVFRGDIALLSLLLFVLDWVLCRLRAALR